MFSSGFYEATLSNPGNRHRHRHQDIPLQRVRPFRTSKLLLQNPEQRIAEKKISSCHVNKYVNFITYNTKMVAPKGMSKDGSSGVIKTMQRMKMEENVDIDEAVEEVQDLFRCDTCRCTLRDPDLFRTHNAGTQYPSGHRRTQEISSSNGKQNSLGPGKYLASIHRWLLGADGDADDEDEADDPKPIRSQYLPSEEKIWQHETTHIPFRAWCPSCVKGMAVNDPHFRRKTMRHMGKPQICIDYSFLGTEESDTRPTLNIKDKKSGKVAAHIVRTSRLNS